MQPPQAGKILHTGSRVSSGDLSSTSSSFPSAFPLLNLLTAKRTFCPGIPFLTVTYLSSSGTYTIPLFGKSTLSIVPSNICLFFILSSSLYMIFKFPFFFKNSAPLKRRILIPTKQAGCSFPHPARMFCFSFSECITPDLLH